MIAMIAATVDSGTVVAVVVIDPEIYQLLELINNKKRTLTSRVRFLFKKNIFSGVIYLAVIKMPFIFALPNGAIAR